MNATRLGTTDEHHFDRRLSDKIKSAFDHACEECKLDVAMELLATLESVLLNGKTPMDRRKAVAIPLIDLHERLWHLKTSGTE